MVFFVANSKSSWIFWIWSAIYFKCSMSSYCRELVRRKPSDFGCIFLIHEEQKWRISHWQTLWMELAALHAYCCTCNCHIFRRKHLHEFLSFQNIHFRSAYSSFSWFVFVFRSCSFFLANVRFLVLLKLSVRPKAYGPLQRSKIWATKQPIRSRDFTESSSSHIINRVNLRYVILSKIRCEYSSLKGLSKLLLGHE